MEQCKFHVFMTDLVASSLEVNEVLRHVSASFSADGCSQQLGLEEKMQKITEFSCRNICVPRTRLIVLPRVRLEYFDIYCGFEGSEEGLRRTLKIDYEASP